MRLWLDFETRSRSTLSAGVYQYVSAEGFAPLLLPWALDDEPISTWQYSERIPRDLSDALRDPAVEVWAHNAGFDRVVMRRSWPDLCPPIERWRCTMIQAYEHGLPGSLDQLCELFHVSADKAKIKDGKRLMHLFCKPNRLGYFNDPVLSPREWQDFIRYAEHDVSAMRELQKLMPSINYPDNAGEVALWHLDQRINDRGILVDIDYVEKALALVGRAKSVTDGAIRAQTDGHAATAQQRDALLDFIYGVYGIRLKDLTQDTVERTLGDDPPEGLRLLLLTRLDGARAGVAKYKALQRWADARDHRVRGTAQFGGASRTMRNAGRGPQPHNLARPKVKHEELEGFIAAVKGDTLGLVYDPDRSVESAKHSPMSYAAQAVRGAFVAPEGRVFAVSDLANIEGRIVAWLAGQDDLLAAFRAYDAGTGPDLYRVAYCEVFGGKPENVDKHGRALGKVIRLFGGYQGGVGAFCTFAVAYRIDLDAMAERALPNLPEIAIAKARSSLEWAKENGMTYGLAPATWIACDAIKNAWRARNARIVQFWYALQDTFCAALRSPGAVMPVGPHVSFTYDKPGLRLLVRLPSGRCVCYAEPFEMASGGRTQIGFHGRARTGKAFGRQFVYGGALLENLAQALARDVLFYRMPEIEAAGYEIVMTVHDEVIAETAERGDAHTELSALLSKPYPWSAGLPLAASGFTSKRYRKD